MFKQGLPHFKVLEIHCSYYKQAKELMPLLPHCQQCLNQFVAQQLTTLLLGSINQFVIDMNLNRGLFRTWLVLSVVFVIGTLAFSFDKLFVEFKNKYSPWNPPGDAVMLVPTDCRGARGLKSEFDTAQLNAINNAKARLATSENKVPEVTIQNYDYVTSREDNHCWYELPKFRALFPEYKDIGDKELSGMLYAKAFDRPVPEFSPWKLLFKGVY